MTQRSNYKYFHLIPYWIVQYHNVMYANKFMYRAIVHMQGMPSRQSEGVPRRKAASPVARAPAQYLGGGRDVIGTAGEHLLIKLEKRSAHRKSTGMWGPS